ncbi:Pre-mRNA-splicing factor SPF27 [Tyrophagus putrescentiae]|nr:Pre-mRNA-splicing factor SPF27 [Tyrophagus putrescentiae]
MTSTHQSLVDALPYIDHEYNDPEIRAAVSQMVEDETKRYKPTKNYLETLPSLPPLDTTKFETEIMRTEFERIKARQPMETLSMKRYDLPPPPAGRFNDVWAWGESLENSFAQLEHQATRLHNLELMATYGTEAWKTYIAFLGQLLERSRRQLDDLRRQIQEVNLERKQSQLDAGERIKMLEESWVALVGKNYEIERACLQLEMEIAGLEKQQSQKTNGEQKELVEEQSPASSETAEA